MTERTSVTVRAAAKINLHLGVGRVRDDGFHPLDTVYQAISLYDDVTLSVAAEDHLSVSGAAHLDLDDIPTDDSNIAVRALAEAPCGVRHRLEISKEIPVAGGMAGGSADGAAALLAHDRLHGLAQPDDVLLEQAARLGSDVPFSLVGGTARGVGRGELVTPVDDRGSWWWVAVPSTTGLSTPAVYRHFDALRPDAPDEPASAEPLLAALGDRRAPAAGAGPAQRPAGAGHRPPPRAGRPDRPGRGRGRPPRDRQRVGAHGRLPVRLGRRCARDRRGPGRRRVRRRAHGHRARRRRPRAGLTGETGGPA